MTEIGAKITEKTVSYCMVVAKSTVFGGADYILLHTPVTGA